MVGTRIRRIEVGFLLSLLLLCPEIARAAMSDAGEPIRGKAPEWRLRTSTENVERVPLLSSPVRVYLERVAQPESVATTNWCTYRIAGTVKPGAPSYVARGATICVSNLDQFAPCPGQTEFRFVDRKGKELGSAYGELVNPTCATCDLETHSQYLIWHP